jgi:hypothetical protein
MASTILKQKEGRWAPAERGNGDVLWAAAKNLQNRHA